MSINFARSSAFYCSLLDLKRTDNLVANIDRTLQLATELINARIGYLELWNEKDDPELIRMCGDREVDAVQRRISRGIIGHSIASRRPSITSSAVADARFKDLDSVRQHSVQSVLVAPVVTDEVIGVLYFEGQLRGGSFTTTDLDSMTRFASELSAVAGRLILRTPLTLEQMTMRFQEQVVREACERNDWNKSAAARELGIDRRTLYRLAWGEMEKAGHFQPILFAGCHATSTTEAMCDECHALVKNDRLLCYTGCAMSGVCSINSVAPELSEGM